MKSSFRIVVQFHKYGIQTASSLYMLLDDSIRHNMLSYEALEELKAYGEVCVDRSGNDSEAVSAIGLEKLTSLELNDVSYSSVSIIVNAKDLCNPSDLMPLILLQNEFMGIVSIGIHYREHFPPENQDIGIRVFTEDMGDDVNSQRVMREKMLGDNDYVAAVFIGGVGGIFKEYEMFRELHPKALVLPIASTGAAAKGLFDKYQGKFDERLLTELSYTSLFKEMLGL